MILVRQGSQQIRHRWMDFNWRRGELERWVQVLSAQTDRENRALPAQLFDHIRRNAATPYSLGNLNGCEPPFTCQKRVTQE